MSINRPIDRQPLSEDGGDSADRHLPTPAITTPDAAAAMSRPRSSRRNFMKSISLAAAAAALPMAALASPPADGPMRADDGELLRLGAEFDALYPRFLKAHAVAVLADGVVMSRVERLGACQSWPRMKAIFDEARREPAVDLEKGLAEQIDEIGKSIRSIPAVTLAGLAVKLRLLQFNLGPAAEPGQGPREDWDLSAECFFEFFEEVHTLAGVPIPTALAVPTDADEVDWVLTMKADGFVFFLGGKGWRDDVGFVDADPDEFGDYHMVKARPGLRDDTDRFIAALRRRRQRV